MIQAYEDDREADNRKFILIKEMVKGKTISERVHDISQIELACMIRNYATALSDLGEYQAFGDS